MIVSSWDGTLQLIRQPDHAALSGLFAQHWGRPPFDRLEPFDAIVTAAAQHDNGWTEWEAQPKVNPATHAPYQFWELPVEEHLGFYFRGVERVIAQDRYAGLLVSMHCSGLYNGRFGTDPSLMVRQFTPAMQRTIDEFLKRLETQRRGLGAELRNTGTPARWLEEAPIWKNYKLLQIFDRLSLYLCMPPFAPRSLGPVPTGGGEDVDLALQPGERNTVRLTPFPFDTNPLVVAVAARCVPSMHYDSDDQFREVLIRADVTTLTFELTGPV
jgi:hypothetical protein